MLRSAFVFGTTAASLLLFGSTGCGTSSNASAPRGFGGCLSYGIDDCPAGCYRSVTEQPNGAGSEPFCSNGIAQCVPGALSWSLGDPADNCPGGPATYLRAGPAPSGSFCCNYDQTADAGRTDAEHVGAE